MSKSALVVALLIALVFHSGDRGAFSAKPRPVGFAYSANFTVYAETQSLADECLKIAETHRKSIAETFLGGPIPNGFGPASISVEISNEDDARTWLLSKEAKRSRHLMWIHSPKKTLRHSIAHEVAHTVLWNRYPTLPVFAHEGVASRYDDAGRIATRRNTMNWFLRTGRWPDAAKVLSSKRITVTDHAKYTASVSLTKYLMSLKTDKETFFQFAVSGAKSHDWDGALRKHYGITSVKSLQKRWQNWAADEED